MKQLTPEQIARTGAFGRWVGQVQNPWEMADEETGELRSGIKIAWFGGSASIQLEDPDQLKLVHEGDLVVMEAPIGFKSGNYKPGKGRVVEINDKPVGKQTKAA